MTEHEMLSMAREAGFEAALIAPEGATSLADGQLRLYGGMLLSLLVFVLSVSRRSCPPEHLAPKPAEKRALSKRTMAAAALIFSLMVSQLLVIIFLSIL